ncbi:MAG: histidine kinase dimerization/phospho-acceptor domain-containing protein, partial [Hyphomicrobiaceae bacterium]
MATAPPLRAPYTTTPVRLAVASAAATVLLLSAVFATVHWVVVDAMTRQTFEALRERAGFALRVDAITNAPALRRAQIEALLGAGSSSDAAQLLSADGRPLWSSGPIAVFEADPSFALEARSARLIAFVAPGRLASGAAASRFAAIQLPTGDGRTLRLARPLLEVEEVSSQLFWGFLAALVAVTATAGLVAYVLGKRLELRLGELATTARDIAANDLTRRLQRTGDGDEIDRLTDTVNAMLERIAGLMAQLREVSDNMAHDLKTPLSRLRLRAETALSSGASPEQLSEALAATIDDADALLKTFETMLLVARLENGAERAPKEVVDAQALLADL